MRIRGRRAHSGLLGLLPAVALAALCACPVRAQLVARFRADQSDAGPAAVRLARQALDLSCLHRERLGLPPNLPPLLTLRGAVFVSTMDAGGAPRCCMGTLYPRGASLAADIVEAATRAAAHDLRFPPLLPAELPHLRVIVSILDPPLPVSDPFRLDPVTDGLAARSALRTGIVLPGETPYLANFVQWARTRAAATGSEQVQYLRLNAIRFMEPPLGTGRLG